MARFRPFRGYRFNPDIVGSMQDIVAPPYDVISESRREELLSSSEYNATHLILNPDGHDVAAGLYRQWTRKGAIERDAAPGFYLYCQEFEIAGEAKRRVGLIGALHLEPFSRRIVLPHEQTFSHHKDDRLKLTKQVRTNLSPIFGLYSNPDFHPEPNGGWDAPADVDVKVEGVRHRLWPMSDPDAIAAAEQAVSGRTVYIADGHHRYETALNYYKHLHADADPPDSDAAPGDGDEPNAHVMAFLAAFEDPGMVILPTHREVVSADGADMGKFAALLRERFHVREFAVGRGGRGAMLDALEEVGSSHRVGVAVALAGSAECFIVEPDGQPRSGSPLAGLDVHFLHNDVIGGALADSGCAEPKLVYTVDRDDLLDHVYTGRSQAGFLMNPTRSDQLASVCEAGELMPQKSTYFYPKLLTGLVFHAL